MKNEKIDLKVTRNRTVKCVLIENNSTILEAKIIVLYSKNDKSYILLNLLLIIFFVYFFILFISGLFLFLKYY